MRSSTGGTQISQVGPNASTGFRNPTLLPLFFTIAQKVPKTTRKQAVYEIYQKSLKQNIDG
jgi:hypothetical protein